MYRLEQSRMKSREKADRYRECVAMTDPPEETRMLSVNPQHGIRMICCNDDEALNIFGDDAETIFCFQSDNIFLSCLSFDLIHIGKRVYLMGDAVAYKLTARILITRKPLLSVVLA